MILAIGYGNPLRSDDAIGQQVAWDLRQHFEENDLSVRVDYQLTPELAELARHFDVVVFIDARVGETPGAVIQETVQPCAGSCAFTHNLTPATLLGMANEFYGTNSTGLLISIVGEKFDYGLHLSPRLTRLLPAITTQTADIIKQHSRIQTHEANHHA
jgi:hydrogenase maturation protease